MGNRRQNKITFRVDDDEWAIIHGLSGQVNLSMEEFIRRRVLSDKKIVVQDKRAIHMLIAEVNRIGNNVNQIARMANSTGVVSRETLREVVSWQQEIYRQLHLMKKDA